MNKSCVAIFILCSACTIGPKFVSVPMGEPSSITSAAGGGGSSDGDPDDPTVEDDFTGSWSATAYVESKSWPLSVTFEKHGTTLIGHVYYSDRRCRAEWSLQSSKPKQWEGMENVTVDPFNRCANHAHVFVEVDDDSLRWRWVSGNKIATASLTREQP